WGANLGEMLGKKNLAKGVKVEVDGESVTIEAFVVIQFGFPIPRVAAGVQQSVKQAVESMTGLNVSAVNVHVSGVLMKKPVEAGEEVEV
ncbi:MAG: Asp23/Gls24 family envelope stress response protein, partial [Methanomassiliicoccales archaeon]